MVTREQVLKSANANRADWWRHAKSKWDSEFRFPQKKPVEKAGFKNGARVKVNAPSK